MTQDVLCALIEAIERAAPELRDKIFPAAADAETPAPYAAYKSGKTPLRTKDGIVAMDETLELAIFDTTMLALSLIETVIIGALDGAELLEKRVTFTQSEQGYYPEFDMHSKSLTFKIK